MNEFTIKESMLGNWRKLGEPSNSNETVSHYASTCRRTTSDMTETQNEEAHDIISNLSLDNKKHISQLFPIKATLGTYYALPKLHKLSHLISAKANTHY